jgi:hypothetical protein
VKVGSDENQVGTHFLLQRAEPRLIAFDHSSGTLLREHRNASVQHARGWRRKAGLVTLAMACMLMFGWARSNFVGDGLAIYLYEALV